MRYRRTHLSGPPQTSVVANRAFFIFTIIIIYYCLQRRRVRRRVPTEFEKCNHNIFMGG